MSDVNSKLGQETLTEFRGHYGEGRVFFASCDVTSMEAVERLYAEALAFFQTESIDLWVNNAGVMGEKEGWKKCMDINLNGVLNGLAVASEKAAATKPVTVINVASILGLFNAKQPNDMQKRHLKVTKEGHQKMKAKIEVSHSFCNFKLFLIFIIF